MHRIHLDAFTNQRILERLRLALTGDAQSDGSTCRSSDGVNSLVERPVGGAHAIHGGDLVLRLDACALGRTAIKWIDDDDFTLLIVTNENAHANKIPLDRLTEATHAVRPDDLRVGILKVVRHGCHGAVSKLTDNHFHWQFHSRVVGCSQCREHLVESLGIYFFSAHRCNRRQLISHCLTKRTGKRCITKGWEFLLEGWRGGQLMHHGKPAFNQRLPTNILKVLRCNLRERLGEDSLVDTFDCLLPVIIALLIEGREWLLAVLLIKAFVLLLAQVVPRVRRILQHQHDAPTDIGLKCVVVLLKLFLLR